jgi:peptidoglycan/LPS O-acetylase OafA/YrhL
MRVAANHAGSRTWWTTVVDQTPRATTAAPEFRSDISGLRAVSVALVVLFHVRLRGAAGGFIGVDVFFVISGFLMTKIIMDRLQAGTFSYWDFVRARAARIWPALGALILGLLLVGAFLLPPSDLLQIAKQSVWALLFWSNQIFLAHAGYATQDADGNWFLHTWSLAVEWQFYLVYPWVLVLASRIGAGAPSGEPRRIGALRVLCWLLPLLAVSFGYYLFESTAHPDGAFFLLTARAWEPLAGGIVYFAETRWFDGRATRRALVSYAGIAMIVGSALWFGYRHLDPVGLGWYSTLPVLGSMLVLWSSWSRSAVLGNAVMQSIGKWSYSIYLWHWPLVVLCAMDAVLDRRPLAGIMFVVVGSVVLGWASYRFVESRARSRTLWGFRAATAKPLLAFGIAALAAGITAASGGLAFRTPHAGASTLVESAEEAQFFPLTCSNYQKPASDVRPCKIERNSHRTVLVIGDSFAEHLYPWFKDHSVVAVDFLTVAGCPPVPHFDRVQPGFHCMDYAQLAWAQALLPRYDTIVISGNWSMVGGVGPRYCHEDAAGGCKMVVGDERRDLVLAELRAALRTLLDAGKTVVVLDVAPIAYVSVPQRIERELYWFGTPRFKNSLASVIAENAWIDPLFASFRGVPGFHLVSLRPTLCHASDCDVYDAQLKRAIYIDDRHFDPVWMAAHGGVFTPFVQRERVP